ncbi:MAG: ABC transporter permease, partial [bacterium]
MWFELKVAWRFLKSGKIQSVLILLGIVIGVSVQVFLGSLIGGLQQDLINETVGTSPHITILSKEETPRSLTISSSEMGKIITFTGKDQGINRWEKLVQFLNQITGITGISPLIDGPGFAVRGQKNVSVIFRGIELNEADRIYNIVNNINSGEADISGNNILIGEDLASDLKLDINDMIQLKTSAGISNRFIVNGIFNLGSKDINSSWIFMSRQRAENF